MVSIQTDDNGNILRLELIPGGQMKLAYELHEMMCARENHSKCQMIAWMPLASKVVKVVLG